MMTLQLFIINVGPAPDSTVETSDDFLEITFLKSLIWKKKKKNLKLKAVSDRKTILKNNHTYDKIIFIIWCHIWEWSNAMP